MAEFHDRQDGDNEHGSGEVDGGKCGVEERDQGDYGVEKGGEGDEEGEYRR